MAKKKFKFKSKFLLLPVLFTVLSLLTMSLMPKDQTVKSPDQELVTKDEPQVEETIENGVYTNHTYGFKFEYPQEIFNDIYEWKESTGMLFRLKGWTVPALWVKRWSYTEKETFYNDCINADTGETFNLSSTQGSPVNVKVSIVNDFCVTQVSPYFYNKHWTYEAVAKSRDGEDYFHLLWEEDTIEDLRQHKEEFYSVIDSFEFID